MSGTSVTKPDQQPAPETASASLERRLLDTARTPEERMAAFQLATRHRQMQMIRQTALAISGKTWGKDGLSQEALVAIARYALEIGVDAVRHIDILGNKVYLNAVCFTDYVTSKPDYRGVSKPEYINDDPRLPEEMRVKRRIRRAEKCMPDDCKGICVVKVGRLMGNDVVWFEGVNHAGHRRGYNAKLKATDHDKQNGDLISDPVGEQDPGKTSFTRALRRAMILAWGSPWFENHPAAKDEDGAVRLEDLKSGVEDLIAQSRVAAPETPVSTAELQDGLAVAGGRPALSAPADPFVTQPAKLPEPVPVERVEEPANSEASPLEFAKSDLLTLMKHPAFTDEDRRLQEKLLNKPNVTVEQIGKWRDAYHERITRYDAER